MLGAESGLAVAEHAAALLAMQETGLEARDYLLMAAMTGYVASGNRDAALRVWQAHGERARKLAAPAFRLLRCHARVADCAGDFAQPER